MSDKVFVSGEGDKKWFGKHVLLDLSGVDFPPHEKTEEGLLLAAKAAGANILHSYFHPFDEGGCGISGVVVLEESHISIHTWPEERFAALDVYMCGECDPTVSAKFLIDYFKPERFEYADFLRGLSKEC